MNIIRALLFSVMLYVASFIVYALAMYTSPSTTPTLAQYIAYWAVTIPVTLILAKWYFKMGDPTFKNGLMLGLIAVGVAFFFDGVSILATASAGKSIKIFQDMYTDWKFYATVLEVIVLCAIAGSEFDKTYTKK